MVGGGTGAAARSLSLMDLLLQAAGRGLVGDGSKAEEAITTAASAAVVGAATMSEATRRFILVRDVFLGIGTVFAVAVFCQHRRLPFLHWRGVPGKTRLLLCTLLIYAPLQTAQDALFLDLSSSSSLTPPPPPSADNGNDLVLGLYLILGFFSSLLCTLCSMLFTFLALHSIPIWRWGVAILLGFPLLLLGTTALTFPGFSLDRPGFFLCWLPHLISFSLWTTVFLLPTPSSSSTALSSFTSLHSSPRQPMLDGATLDQDVKQRMAVPVFIYTSLGLLLMLLGVSAQDDKAREAFSVLLGAVFKLCWPLQLWCLVIGLEQSWGYEWSTRRSISTRRGEELLFEYYRELGEQQQQGVVVVEEEEEEEGGAEAVAARTLAALLPSSAREILIDFSDLQLDKTVARGGSGIVRKGKLHGRVEVAAKSLYSQYMMGDLDEIIAEAKVLARLHHPNVLTFHGMSLNPANNTVYLITEWCPRGTMEQLVLHGAFDRADFYRYGRVLCQAMAFLHRSGVVHRDLKPSNILLDANLNMKIGDFGLALSSSSSSPSSSSSSPLSSSLAAHGSEALSSSSSSPPRHRQLQNLVSITTGLGTPQYLAPEAARGHGKVRLDAAKIDVYSAALILWFFYFKTHPYAEHADNAYELVSQVVSGARPSLESSLLPMPSSLQALLSAMWHADPSKRPTMAEAAEALGDIEREEGEGGPPLVIQHYEVLERV